MDMENVLALLAVMVVGMVVAGIAAVVLSPRIKSKGIRRTLWREILSGDRYEKPYRG
jgi:hypothetical protein